MAEAEKTEELGGLGEGEATLLENDGLDNNEDLDLGDQMSDVERQARDQGWLPRNEFKGNPDDHKSAKHYVEWGDMKGSIKTIKNQMTHQKKSYEDQIVNQNILHKADTERQLAEVKAQLVTAIDDGDTTAATALAEKQSELNIQKNKLENVQTDAGANDVEIMRLEWEAENQWFFDQNDPRVAAAHSAYNLAIRKGGTPEEAFAAVDDRVSKMSGKPKINQNRLNPSDTATSTGGGNRGTKARKITMNDVTPKEMHMRAAFPDGESGDKVFLKAIENSRKGV